MSDRKRRVNGLEPPWHEFQIATWFLFPIILVHYYAFLMHLLWRPDAVVIVLTILFSLFAISCAVSAYYTLSIDPIDDAVLCVEVGTPAARSKANTIHCYLCEKDVDNSSKHCRFCDKCIVRFDHHCKWLNTCVGQKNYHWFLAIVASVFLLTAESLGISIALVVEAFAYPDSLMDRVSYHNFLQDRIGSALSLGALQGLLIASVVVLLGLVGMIVQLGTFHIMLIWRGITTYDYIVSEQKRLREKENKRLQRQVEKQNRAKSRTVGASDNRNADNGNSAASGTGAGIELRAGANAGPGGRTRSDPLPAAMAAGSAESKSSEPSDASKYSPVATDADAGESDIVPYDQQQELVSEAHEV